MPKQKTIFECEKCDAQFPAWEGRCRECGNWSTLKETSISRPPGSGFQTSEVWKTINPADDKDLIDINTISSQIHKKISLNDNEIDRVLGGGLVSGSLVLLGGDPGVGKSTLVFKIADAVARQDKSVFYVSGEESPEQIKGRLDKMNLILTGVKLLNKTDVDIICATLLKHKPDLAIIDSIQTIRSSEASGEMGGQTQIKAVIGKLLETAKKNDITILIVGHVTKNGSVAGPKTMEHLVDVVLYLEGEKDSSHRILRSVKNRFAKTSEIGIFKMTNQGLDSISDPSETFISKNKKPTPGTITSVIWEGSRAFLVEIQALTNKTSFKYPKRASHGIEANRLQLLLAVMEKQGEVKLKYDDVYINLAGGLKTKDRALDLAICMAIASAKKNSALNNNNIVIGEISLNGEIKSVANLEQRVREAIRLGYKSLIIPKTNLKFTSQAAKITTVENLAEAIQLI